MKNQVFFIFLYLLCVLFGASCTRDKNPLEPPKQKPNPRVLKGNAKLENQTDHYGILVYLEGLKLYTLTDEMGDYTLTIPDSLFSGDSLTVQGTFHIYYSFIYYDFDSSTVLTNRQGFVRGQGNVDGQGQVAPVELKQYLDFKSITDKKVYTPTDTFWVQITLANLSNRKIGVHFIWQGRGYPICETTLFSDLTFWYFVGPSSFAEDWIKLNPGQSIDRSCRYPLASIKESHWGISFPWECYVKPSGFYIYPGLKDRPETLKGVVHELGWPYGRYLPDSISFYSLLVNKFSLAQITITK